jgi:hypothetical protein
MPALDLVAGELDDDPARIFQQFRRIFGPLPAGPSGIDPYEDGRSKAANVITLHESLQTSSGTLAAVIEPSYQE